MLIFVRVYTSSLSQPPSLKKFKTTKNVFLRSMKVTVNASKKKKILKRSLFLNFNITELILSYYHN